MACMFLLNRHILLRKSAAHAGLASFVVMILSLLPGAFASKAGQQARLPFATGGVAELSSSGPQSRRGDLYIADGDVDIHYGDSNLRADHVEYNNKTSDSLARGNVKFDFENQHLEADEARYNVKSGRGTFLHVRGAV
ncbi:MAG: hypothetical protein M3N22_04875, partial [Acidobacteriota bacterium]|nr:hypothetical protein [Acidobacteriota bacterium]